ncbi:MAG TPA: NAD(P)-dependent oxidoreductase [Bacteroidales bacterium]|nr:NAD(P)-dependent oxidoreductase [Bacteroidales bacterium]HPS16590.1 NAD(P)-dependent oxidoreductase [Bacteroidales bacterium]
MSTSKKVLVTGASGTVGSEVVKQLCEKNDNIEITVFDKKNKNSERFFSKISKRVKVIYGDISNKEDVCNACKNQDVVIHLAAIIPPLADKQPQLANKVNVIGTKNLIECLEEFSPKVFFLYASSISVYGDRIKNPWIKVTDDLKPSDRDEYGLTKIEAEKLVTNSELNWSIFRLTAIMGAGNHKASGIMFHMPLETKMEIATPYDAARAFVHAVNHLDELNKNIYNLSGGEKCRISYQEFLSSTFKLFGLGDLDFQENSFAKRNFHCGYYEDVDKLHQILDFRRVTIDDYFRYVKESVSPFQKVAASVFKKMVKKSLQKQSEPLAAIKNKNETDLKHYF